MKDAAFAKCSGLTDVTVHALVPPVIESFHYYPFEGCYDKATQGAVRFAQLPWAGSSLPLRGAGGRSRRK
ncbi:MAG: hypothetical protein SPK03_05625 [Alloprevotella sp.]|nr:hypothetical protein [Alloprevotella sp.]